MLKSNNNKGFKIIKNYKNFKLKNQQFCSNKIIKNHTGCGFVLFAKINLKKQP